MKRAIEIIYQRCYVTLKKITNEFVVFLCHKGELQLHLQPMVNLLRDEDTMRLVSCPVSHAVMSVH